MLAKANQAPDAVDHEANARRAIQLEAAGKLDPSYAPAAAFDPETATPDQLNAWLAQMGAQAI